MAFLYYLGLFLCSAASTYSVQKYSRASRNFADIWIYTALTGLIAMGVFWVMSGFSLSFNLPTVIYSLIYGMLVLVIHFSNLLSLRYMGITQAALCSSTLTLVLSLLSGVLLFAEQANFITVGRILLMLAATWLAVLRKDVSPAVLIPGKKGRFFLGICLRLICSAASVGATVVTKYFAMDTGVTDTNSFFFMTNVVLTVISLLSLAMFCRGDARGAARELKSIGLARYGAIVLNTVASNLSSTLTVLILATGSVSYFTPVSGALGIIATESVAVLIAREKPNIIPIILAALAMLLGFLEM